MKNKKGISLITLILTIVFIIIFAGAIILDLVEHDLIGKAKDAKKANIKMVATDEVELSTGDLFIEQSFNKMTQEDKRVYLEDKLKKYKEDSTVEISDTGFIAKHRGYIFVIDSKLELANVGEEGEEGEWDSLATPDDYFEWDETGTIIIGYTEKIRGVPKIRVPSKCKEINVKEFWGTVGSRSRISEGVIKIELPNTITSIGDYSFVEFRSLKDINIPESVTNIGAGAFLDCDALTSVIIPDNVINVGVGAFGGLSMIQIVYCEAAFKPSGWHENWDCSDLSESDVCVVWNYKEASSGDFNAEEWDKTATNENLFEWDETGTIITGYTEKLAGNEKIRIPSKCVAIVPGSVWQNSSNRSEIASGIKKIELPSTIYIIGDYAFTSFEDLEEIDIPNSVLAIGKYAFSFCRSLNNIEIPDSVTKIKEGAFYYCTGLTNITLPETITTIESYLFAGCDNLTSVILPQNITTIGERAFRYCSNLTEVTLQNNVTSIGLQAFDECYSLNKITLPDSLTSIEQAVFTNCTGLTSIIIPNSVNKIGLNAFNYWTSNQTIYCRAIAKPSGWINYWYGYNSNVNIEWGYTGE